MYLSRSFFKFVQLPKQNMKGTIRFSSKVVLLCFRINETINEYVLRSLFIALLISCYELLGYVWNLGLREEKKFIFSYLNSKKRKKKMKEIFF